MKPEAADRQMQLADMRKYVFEEQDRAVLEAQQRMQEKYLSGVKPLLLSIDAASVCMRRLLEKMVSAEAGTA